jgi:prepilin-type N-terminal cleavage/methylation domain-containing protein
MISLNNVMFKLRNLAGFTLIEITITIAILGLLSGLVLSNLRVGERSRAVRAAADTMQSILRQVQFSSLSGESFSSNPAVAARDFGWQTASNWGQIQIFKEQANIASPYNKTVFETVNFPSNVVIDSGSLRIGSDTVASMEIRFFPPYGEVRISGGSYSEAKNVIATFNIIYSNTAIAKTVVVDGISGRISVQ